MQAAIRAVTTRFDFAVIFIIEPPIFYLFVKSLFHSVARSALTGYAKDGCTLTQPKAAQGTTTARTRQSFTPINMELLGEITRLAIPAYKVL
jgi:hypothetical protein